MGVQIRQGEGAFWRVVRFIEVRRESPCQKINNGITAPLLQQTAMLSTGWCHITFSPLKNPPTWDAAFHQNPSTTFYPHRPTGKVWIYRLLFVCFFCLHGYGFAPPRIKLAASNVTRRFIGVQGRESHIFVNFAPTEAQNRTNRRARGPHPPTCKHYRTDAPT